MALAAAFWCCWPSVAALLLAWVIRPALALAEPYPALSLLWQELHRPQGQGLRGCPELLGADWGGEQYAAASGDCGE